MFVLCPFLTLISTAQVGVLLAGLSSQIGNKLFNQVRVQTQICYKVLLLCCASTPSCLLKMMYCWKVCRANLAKKLHSGACTDIPKFRKSAALLCLPAKLSAALAHPGQLQRHTAALTEPQQLHLPRLPPPDSWQCFKQQLLHQHQGGCKGLNPAGLSCNALQHKQATAQHVLCLLLLCCRIARCWHARVLPQA